MVWSWGAFAVGVLVAFIFKDFFNSLLGNLFPSASVGGSNGALQLAGAIRGA